MAMDIPDFPPGLERVVLDGIELHYLTTGDGAPVLLVHGGGDDLRYWEAQLGPLSARYRVTVYSRRHSAPNDNPIRSSNHSAELEADDLERLIDTLGLDRFHLGGHSYGALTALLLALRRPASIRTLTLCEPPMLAWAAEVPGGDAIVREFTDAAWRPGADAFLRRDPRAIAILYDGIIGAGVFDSMPEELRARALGNARDLEAICISPDMFPPVSLDAVRQLAAPTLLLTGARTTPINTIGLAVLDRLLPNHELVTIPDATHELFVEQPEASTRALLAFLARH
jgi:pimeloyl-ACP methyl ester carboxylesterase